MKIATHIPKKLPFSIKNYIENVTNILTSQGVEFINFSSKEELELAIKNVDLIWFPDCAGGSAPSLEFVNLITGRSKPTVATIHGAAPFSVPPKLYYPSIKSALKGEIYKYISFFKWQIYKKIVNKIITVSNYAKYEISKKLKLPEGKINVVYHGVDSKLFNTNSANSDSKKYFLHISQYQPIKNVSRIIEAYEKVDRPKPDLLLVIPGFEKDRKYLKKDINIITTPVSQQKAAKFYKKAIAFLFPSLRESFGMPILEAMACGCPVITSNVTACSEVARDAALLVNPYSVEDIAEAMEKIIRDKKLREELSQRGLQRAKEFTWEKSAEKHLKVFKEALEGM